MKPDAAASTASNVAIVVPAQLDPRHFEVLVALLWQRIGYHVIITPVSANQGIDVVAIGNNEVHLIQVRHETNPIDETALDDLARGSEYYRSRILNNTLRSYTEQMVLARNGKIARATTREAHRRDMQILDEAEFHSLVSRYKPTLAEIEALALQRCRNLAEVAHRVFEISGASRHA